MTALTTLVLGASPRHDRYSHLAVRRLLQHGHAVVAVGRHAGTIHGVRIDPGLPAGAVIDTVTLYLNPDNQRAWEDQLLALRPRRIIFNPGAENPAFARRARAAGIEVMDACTLVMLSIGDY